MSQALDIWKILAGIAIFLLGMSYLEEALRQLAGRSFKLFLKRQTSYKLKAIGGGVIVTAVLQGSSVVNLMVLAFVGAGVIKMQNALAVTLGANFGTTLDSWVVAAIGFKFNIESFALPITGIAGVVMFMVKPDSRLYQWSKFLLGFGFLFVGLNFIRTGIEEAVKQIDLSSFNHYPAIIFLLMGFFITALIQSSLATVTIVLSALHVNAISLYAGAAIVLGAEIGTAVKLIIASLKGTADQKRLAVGNILFNTINVLVIFIVLRQVIYFITEIVKINDRLFSLVFFQSLVNLIGIFLFYPFLNVFGRFLENRFKKSGDETFFINKVSPEAPEMALEALNKELHYFIFNVIDFGLDTFDIKINNHEDAYRKKFQSKSYTEKYEYMKHLHGDLHGYYIKLQKTVSGPDEDAKLGQLISTVRNCMYAAKSMKDAYGDVDQLRNSSNDVKYDFFNQTRAKVEEFYGRLLQLLSMEKASYYDELVSLYKSVQEGYTDTLQSLYQKSSPQHLSEIETSTLVNFNREMYTSLKALIWGVKDYLLDEDQVEYFDSLPGFIR